MIGAISAVYGPPLSRVRRAKSRLETESGSPAARWGDTDYEVVLYRTSDVAAFRLIVTEVRLDGLARKAETQALLLEDQDAPRREITRQPKDRADRRATAVKAPAANKGLFRP
jgi:hypothetical protein